MRRRFGADDADAAVCEAIWVTESAQHEPRERTHGIAGNKVSMKIAQIAPPWLNVPPNGYGGIEAMVALLCDGLVERGHDVTLFASGGSSTKARLVSRYGVAPGMAASAARPMLEIPHLLQAYERSAEFDVIHDHTFPVGPSIGANLTRPSVVHTVHGPSDLSDARPIYEALDQRVHLVALSHAQRLAVPSIHYTATIYNGIAVEAFPFRSHKDDYLLFVGRMGEEKGVHLAIEVARRLGRRLKVAAKMEEPDEVAYFEAKVRPRLNADIEILGQVSGVEKLGLYANAACTLMPVQWSEPFGLVMVESMACGTPVVALRKGSVAEIIQHEVTGFIADDLDSIVDSVTKVDRLEPKACRKAVITRFTKERMVDGYERVYRAVTTATAR
jgi:glycosyltransferase involved in cell wall biosynthesis